MVASASHFGRAMIAHHLHNALMTRILYRYFLLAGLLANLLVAAFFAHWAFNKFLGSEGFRSARRTLAGSPDGVEVMPIEPVRTGTLNPQLEALPPATWYKIHQQAAGDPLAFERQEHSGAAFDPTRGRLMLFGSNTHGRNWDNSVRFFDVATLQWGQYYPPSPRESYRVDSSGVPVAGRGERQPWAMHTFDAVNFDPAGDRLLVASQPDHLNPSRFGNIDPALWRTIRHHPTWAYHVAENRWEPLTLSGESFFPYGTALDPAKWRILGVKSSGYWSFSLDSHEWEKLGTGDVPRAWHNAVALDTRRQRLVSFGTNTRANDVWQYDSAGNGGRKMPTPGERPPGAESVPLVYHPEVDRVVALVETGEDDDAGRTETWLYATGADSWTRLGSATLPFRVGMNYNLVYDPNHDLLLLVASYPREPTAVWALKLHGD